MKSLKQIKGAQILSAENLKSITGGATTGDPCPNGHHNVSQSPCTVICHPNYPEGTDPDDYEVGDGPYYT